MVERAESLIVVGVDGSQHSKAALRWAVAQARLTGSRVHAVMSWEWNTNPFQVGSAAGAGEEPLTVEHAARARLAQSVTEAVGEVTDVTVRQRVVQGPPARVLVEASEGATTTVVGTRGYGGFKGALLGSVSQQVVQYAPCTVVIVREDGK
ncbi:universal stress protein (plasmid) [Streptomyces sp. BI20]|uniref:universal stress protein n=1 Tax=Streptomyces sp. BI20 TaxID=3403460 RepID=UPI003C74724B